jgi:hypothetical protein
MHLTPRLTTLFCVLCRVCTRQRNSAVIVANKVVPLSIRCRYVYKQWRIWALIIFVSSLLDQLKVEGRWLIGIQIKQRLMEGSCPCKLY